MRDAGARHALFINNPISPGTTGGPKKATLNPSKGGGPKDPITRV
jgi:hypothetical protein